MDKLAKMKTELEASIKEVKAQEVELEAKLEVGRAGRDPGSPADGTADASAEPKLGDAAKLLAKNFEKVVAEAAKQWGPDQCKAAIASLGALLGGGAADSVMGDEDGGKADGKRGAGEACAQGDPSAFRGDLMEDGYSEEEADKTIRTFGKNKG